MKKLLCFLLICSTLTIFSNSVALPLNAVAVEGSSIEEDLENAYTLLKQFAANQKESISVYTPSEFFSSDELPERFQNKVFLEFFAYDEEVVLASVKSFMLENGIDESLVEFFVMDLGREPEETPVEDMWWDAELSETLENAYTLLKQFVAEQKENGNSAFSSVRVCTPSEYWDYEEIPEYFQNKVILDFAGYDKEDILASIKPFMLENGIDENLVTYIWTDEGREIEETPTLFLGDVNGDEDINVLDVITINRAVVGKEILTEAEQTRADVNGDQTVDAADSLLILKYLVGMIEHF